MVSLGVSQVLLVSSFGSSEVKCSVRVSTSTAREGHVRKEICSVEAKKAYELEFRANKHRLMRCCGSSRIFLSANRAGDGPGGPISVRVDQ